MRHEIYRHPNTNLRQRLEARLAATDHAARLARPLLAEYWLDGSMRYEEDAEPLHLENGRLDYAAARSAVQRARKLGLIR